MVKVEYDDFKYDEFEYQAECNECGVDLKISEIPKRLKEKSYRENDDFGLIWVSEQYWYCPKCQKEFGYHKRE